MPIYNYIVILEHTRPPPGAGVVTVPHARVWSTLVLLASLGVRPAAAQARNDEGLTPSIRAAADTDSSSGPGRTAEDEVPVVPASRPVWFVRSDFAPECIVLRRPLAREFGTTRAGDDRLRAPRSLVDHPWH